MVEFFKEKPKLFLSYIGEDEIPSYIMGLFVHGVAEISR